LSLERASERGRDSLIKYYALLVSKGAVPEHFLKSYRSKLSTSQDVLNTVPDMNEVIAFAKYLNEELLEKPFVLVTSLITHIC